VTVEHAPLAVTDGSPFEEDRTLARIAASGDDAALRALLRRVTPRLKSMGWHMSYDSYESEDLCQEALLKITSPAVLRRYRGDGPLEAYLLNVGVRAMLSVRRTRRSAQWREAVVTESVPEPAPGATSPIASLDPTLRAAFEQLPDRARLIVLLIAIGDYSYHDVAEVVELPVGTVKSAYSRARASLRAALADSPAALGADR
jgi:RNA polymerase sigma-70 factor (ECF subfamily)